MTFLMTKLVYVYHKTQLFDILREWKNRTHMSPLSSNLCKVRRFGTLQRLLDNGLYVVGKGGAQ